MSHNVRTHTRRTASGKTVTVRQHDRRGGSGGQPPQAPGKNPKRLLFLSCCAIVVLIAAIVTGTILMAISALFMLLAVVFEFTRLMHTPKVRRKPQREDWWDEDAPSRDPS